MNEVDANELLKRMDGCRGMYFFDWLMGQWANDKKRLESVSVAELVLKYDSKQFPKRLHEVAPKD